MSRGRMLTLNLSKYLQTTIPNNCRRNIHTFLIKDECLNLDLSIAGRYLSMPDISFRVDTRKLVRPRVGRLATELV